MDKDIVIPNCIRGLGNVCEILEVTDFEKNHVNVYENGSVSKEGVELKIFSMQMQGTQVMLSVDSTSVELDPFDDTIVNDEPITFLCTLKEYPGNNPVEGVSVNVYENSNPTRNFTSNPSNSNGETTITFTPIKTGLNTILFSIIPSSVYTPWNHHAVINLYVQDEVQIEAASYYGYSNNISGVVYAYIHALLRRTSDNEIIENAILEVSINGTVYNQLQMTTTSATSLSDSNVAESDIIPMQGMTGEEEVIIHFVGTDDYSPAQLTIMLGHDGMQEPNNPI